MAWLPYDAGLSAAAETLLGILKRVIVSPTISPRFLEIAVLARKLSYLLISDILALWHNSGTEGWAPECQYVRI